MRDELTLLWIRSCTQAVPKQILVCAESAQLRPTVWPPIIRHRAKRVALPAITPCGGRVELSNYILTYRLVTANYQYNYILSPSIHTFVVINEVDMGAASKRE